MSQYPGNCLCGCGWHPTTCWRCGCAEFAEDDGTDGPRTMPTPDYKTDQYQGQYQPKGGYTI